MLFGIIPDGKTGLQAQIHLTGERYRLELVVERCKAPREVGSGYVESIESFCWYQGVGKIKFPGGDWQFFFFETWAGESVYTEKFDFADFVHCTGEHPPRSLLSDSQSVAGLPNLERFADYVGEAVEKQLKAQAGFAFSAVLFGRHDHQDLITKGLIFDREGKKHLALA